MIDVDWNDNAKAAVMEYAKYMEQERIANGWLNGRGGFSPKPNFKATRENLEKIAKDAQGDFVEVEQEGEKWTHTIDGLKVRFLVDGPDEAGEVPVVADDGYYHIFDVDQLKPIKPTISESEMMERIKYRAISIDDDDEFGAKVRAWLDQYDII